MNRRGFLATIAAVLGWKEPANLLPVDQRFQVLIEEVEATELPAIYPVDSDFFTDPRVVRELHRTLRDLDNRQWGRWNL
jgi:hypothetical protein